MNSFYWAKTAFVSLMMISSITFEATCTGPVSDLFNSLIVGITSANEGEHSAASISNQRPLELKLADAQMLQQWIGQIARKIVVEDGIFAGSYSRGPNININAVILTDGLPKERIKKIDKNILKELKEVQNLEQKGQFLKLLFSFGAMLSVEIGDQPQQNGTLRALLKAYECVGGKFAEEKDGIADFVIGAVIKSPIVQLKVDKLILERNNRRRIHELSLLNALNVEMTPKDVISFAAFIYNKFVSYPPINPFNKFILGWRELSLSTLDKDPVKYRRIAYQLLLHLKNWGPNELKEISLKKSDEDVIQLTQREKCFFGIFTRNLMQRMAKFELLEDYFGELNISRLIEYIQDYLAINEEYSANNCKKEKKNEGIENSKIYPFLDEAIRIDWNVWKGIIREIDELTKTVKSMDSKKEFTEYLEGAIFNEAMEIIMAKFSEFGLKLKAEVEEMLKLDDETMPIDEIVNQFCINLAKIRQICEKNIKQYEKEIPLKRNVRIKQKETYNKSYDLMAENYNKFYDFIAIFVKHFGRNSIKNDNGKSIEFDLNWAKSFLEKLYNSATNQIVKKNESEEFKCLPNKKMNFETAIRAILDQNLNEKAKNLLKEFSVPPKNAEKEGGLKHLVEAQLFNLFFSFAARLEAIVHGKNIDGTIKKSRENPKNVHGKNINGTIEKSRENSKDKIRAFLAVPNCFNVPEWANKFSIFDYWMEIKVINSKSQIPAIGVEIFKKIDENEEAKRISRGNYKTLQRLNEQKFSIYESTKLLRHIYDRIEQKHSTTDEVKMPTIFKDLVSEIRYKWRKESNSDYRNYIDGCEFAKLFQNVSANFMNMKGIDVTLHMDKLDSKIQDYVKRDFEKHCEIIKRIDRTVEETKIALLNNVRYDLVINFKFNAWKDVRDRAEDLLGNLSTMEPTKEATCIIENEITMTYYFTSKETNRERISKIEALKAKENDRFDLMGLFDSAHNLAWKIIKEEIPNLEKAKKELEPLEQSEKTENDEKKKLYEAIENIARQIQDKETEAINLENEMNLLQEKFDKIPEKQRKNAAPFLGWFKSNREVKITNETQQILKKIYTLSKLKQKVIKLKAKMKESQLTLTLELGIKLSLGDKLSMGDVSTNKKLSETFKKILNKLKMDDKITEALDMLKIAQLEGLEKVQEKMDLVEEKLEVNLEKAKQFKTYRRKDLLELAKENNIKDLYKIKMTEKMDEFEYEKMGNELAQQTDDILLTNGFEQKLDSILTVCKFKWDENKLNNIGAKLESLIKTHEEMKEKLEEIGKKLSEILKKKVQKQKEVNTLEKELYENKKYSLKMWNRLGQMLEEMKKYYGQKMDKQKKDG